MVVPGLWTMGNGSIKAPRNEDPQTQTLRLQVQQLELDLVQREQDFKAHLDLLQKELDSKTSQIHKLQDALGHNGLDSFPQRRVFSAINRAQTSFQQVALEVHRRLRAKDGVSAEPTSESFCGPNKATLESSPRSGPKTRTQGPASGPTLKDSQTKRLITEALLSNDFLKELDLSIVTEIGEFMYETQYSAEERVIQEGAPGEFLYVLTEGVLEVEQSGRLLGQMFPGTAFGELAILYNCKRTATVRAVTDAQVWTLDRQSFQSIVRRTTQQRHLEHCSFLRSVSLLKDLPQDKLSRIADCLQAEFYDKGEFIIREGEEGDTFFIISRGQVLVTQTAEGFSEPQEIKTLTVGDHFGEKALISEDVRSANIICCENNTHCLTLDRESFVRMVGTWEELQVHVRSYVEELSLSDQRRHKRAQSPVLAPAETTELIRLRERLDQLRPEQPLDQLQLIATLGMGGFGRVELVKLEDEQTTFALKCIKKQHVVENSQQQHVYSEKIILQEIHCPFITRFFRTFRDKKFVYLLLEACLGGELWTVLRDMNFFDESTARFCCACVLEALEYLHQRNIIYRDLKPENLLLDQDGYLKLADFGFAKRLVCGRKTWTFCGTPEYVAPEVILNRGHDAAVDLWATGILLYELLTGSPPFSGSDPIKIYTSILHGVEKMDFPKKIRKRADDLIRHLCRLNPVERLGNNKNGINDIRKHKWFQGFNWDGLKWRSLPSPLTRQVNGPTDHSHFDVFPPETEEPPDELSGWDHDF